MKRKLLPLMIASLATGYAAADVSVYGKINVSFDKADYEDSTGSTSTTDEWQLNSNASRLGFKGDFEISDNLKAIYKLEYETAIDDGDVKGQTFGQRNIYGGFTGNWGTLITGKFDTPMKESQGKVDMFNDYAGIGDMKNVIKAGEHREGNSVQYTTPNMGGFTAAVDFMPGEDTAGGDDGIADHVSAAIQYSMEGLRVAVAHDKDVAGQDTTRAVVEFTSGIFHVGALAQQYETADTTVTTDIEGDAYLLSGAVTVAENVALKLQFGSSSEDDNIANNTTDRTYYGAGVDYKLSKAAKVFVYGISLDTEDDLTTDKSDSIFGAGYELKF